MSNTQRLYRSEKDKIFAGVCGGLADYFLVDPVIIRLIFVLLGLFHGIGIVAYFVMWVIVPKKEDMKYRATNFNSDKEPEIVDAEIIDEEDDKTEEPKFSSSEKERFEENRNMPPRKNGHDGKSILGITLVVIGGIILLERIFPVITFKLILPTILIALGLYFLFDNNHRSKRHENK